MSRLLEYTGMAWIVVMRSTQMRLRTRESPSASTERSLSSFSTKSRRR